MPARPPKLPTFTITPLSRSSILGSTARIMRIGDSKLVVIVCRTSSIVISCTWRRFGMAALLMSTSRPPMSSHAWSTSASAASVSPRSRHVHARLRGVHLALLEHLGEAVLTTGDDPHGGAARGEQGSEGGTDAGGGTGEEDVGLPSICMGGTVSLSAAPSDTRVMFIVHDGCHDDRRCDRARQHRWGDRRQPRGRRARGDGHGRRRGRAPRRSPGRLAVGSIAEVAAASEVTFTSLPTPAVVAAAAHEWMTDCRRRARCCSTCRPPCPQGNRDIAAALAAAGFHFVEAPLTGGAVGAQGRSLVFMVGGEPDAVARCTPLLDKLGRATIHMGPVGTGTTMKLINSLLAFSCTWASLEGLSLAAAAGIDVRTAVEVVRTGGASNFFIDRAVEGINNRNRPAQFALDLAAKDAGLIEQVAAASGVPASMAAAMIEVLADAVDPWHWATTTGATSCSSPRPAATSSSTDRARRPTESA